MKNIVTNTIGVRNKIESITPVNIPISVPKIIDSLTLSGLFNKAGTQTQTSSTHSGIIPNIIFKVNIMVAINIELTIILIQVELSNFISLQLRV